MSDEARCPRHDVPASGVCARCGRFGCEACLAPVLAATWCAECRARPETRLVPSPEARRALWLAVAALHGVLPLRAVSLWLSRRELRRIAAGASSVAGQPWALGAGWLSLAALVVWVAIAFSVLS